MKVIEAFLVKGEISSQVIVYYKSIFKGSCFAVSTV
jgi:hypothetical protein